MIKKIDFDTYPRREHFKYFCTLQYPYFGVTVDVDVTDLVSFCRKNGCSFYLTMLHLTALAADEIPALRQRIRDGGIVEYDRCPTSHVELLEDGTYCYCTLHHEMGLEEYLVYAQREREACRNRRSIQEDENVEQMYFVTSLPWLHYSALIQPVACGEESNPRISWGKFTEDNRGRLQLPVTLLVHHALADGIHAAAFYEQLQEKITALTR